MSAEAGSLLVQATLASSAAALLVIAFRRVARRVFGARSAYWIWVFVPAVAAVVLLPRSERRLQVATGLLSRPMRAAVSGALSALDRAAAPSYYSRVLLVVWVAGALVSLVLILRRHRAFVGSLGEMSPRSDGSLRAAACREPLLLGVLRPRIVLPADFDTRYGPNERAMVLAHEQAHLRRRDPQINAIAALWLCLAWFNPLMHWALRLFRFDQELACDAATLAAPGTSPRRYADALLKTQVDADLARERLMMGCHWHSSHPLAERIHMLKHPLPGELRRRSGLVLMLTFVGLGCYGVRAAQSQAAPASPGGPLIAVNMKVDGLEQLGAPASTASWDFVLSSGGDFSIGAADGSHGIRCTARVPSPDSSTSGAYQGTVLLGCKLTHFSVPYATPTLLVREGETASIDVADAQHNMALHFEFNASTEEARVAAAQAAAAQAEKAPGVRTFQSLIHSPAQ